MCIDKPGVESKISLIFRSGFPIGIFMTSRDETDIAGYLFVRIVTSVGHVPLLAISRK